MNLPGWYGLGSGLEALGDMGVAREAYREWPVFAALVDVAEISLAKTDDALALRFLALVVGRSSPRWCSTSWRGRGGRCSSCSTRRRCCSASRTCTRPCRMRRPFVDTLSHLQLRGLSEVRAHGDDGAAGCHRPLLLTINGLAAGLQNTG